MKKHKTYVIEVAQHTDYRSDPKYSTVLSANRARTITKTLIDSFGIAPERLSPKGYENSKPRYLEKAVKTPNGKVIPAGTVLSEKWIDTNFPKTKDKNDYEFVMQLNRRTELKVLKTNFVSNGNMNNQIISENIKGNWHHIEGTTYNSLNFSDKTVFVDNRVDTVFTLNYSISNDTLITWTNNLNDKYKNKIISITKDDLVLEGIRGISETRTYQRVQKKNDSSDK